MSKIRLTIQTFALLALTLTLTSLAQAQATRTWVSGVGDDVNPCSRTAPCKTWAGAISKTAAGGEIDALDPGGFGTLTITKSLTVDGTFGAGFGSTLNSGGINGFVINDSQTATPNTSVVTLRRLSINGAGTTKGLNGIRALAFSRLLIEDVTVENQSNHGIDIAPASNAKVDLNRVTVNGVGQRGVSATAPSGFRVTVAIRGSHFFNNNIGVLATNNSRVSCYECVASNNALSGFQAQSLAAGQPAELNLESCTAFGHDGAGDLGVGAGGGGGSGDIVRIKGCGIYNNTTGVAAFVGGTVFTFLENAISGNTTNVSGALTPGGPQ
jgi:hypothetical protein